WSEVCTTSGAIPRAAISSPAAVACCWPSSVSWASHHPVKRLSLFHSLSPWRSSTSRYVMGSDDTHGSTAAPNRRGPVVRASDVVDAVDRDGDRDDHRD